MAFVSPSLIVVNGMWGSGKTTLARRLAADLKLPLLCRDGLKEVLYDSLGPEGDIAQRLGPASYELLFYLCERLLMAGTSHLLESNFSSTLAPPRFIALQGKYRARLVQLHLRAPLEVLIERSLARLRSGERHAVHYKERELLEVSGEDPVSWLRQNPRLLPSLDDQPMPLPGPLIPLETTDFSKLDYDAVLQRVSELLEEAI